MDFGGSGYRKSHRVVDAAGDPLATLLHGSRTSAANLRGSGHSAEPVAALIRTTWPIHNVSRIDVCQDMTNPGLFKRCERTMRRVALAAGLETGLTYVPDIADKGRTYRVGGNTSATIVRLYEKGLEQLGKGKVTLAEVDRHLVRLEIQHRPRRAPDKLAVATLEPTMVWGVSSWTKELAMKIMNLDVPRFTAARHVQSEWEVADIHLRMQWARHMIDGGRRLARAETGDAKPPLVDSVDAYLAHLRPLLLEAGRSRGAEIVDLDPTTQKPFAIH